MLDGRHVELPTRELSGGARVRYVFNELFGRAMRDQAPSRGIRWVIEGPSLKS